MSTVAMEEYDLMKDSKYRLYVAAVDKALKNFEYTSEWADLISALGKLNKVLLSYTKFPVIPRRIKISKRLAQCMHPALPSGVHLKALETYDIIFRCMGTNRLAHELFIYSAGLFPLMSHAAMKIRPTLLTIYETHFVPLAERLRPALSGFLSGILPGLDTGTDHFDRTNSLLENVCEGVEPPYFFTCIWQCVANNSPVRLPAISYVLAHYSKKLSMEDQLHLMGNDIGLMVSGLCAAVQDSSVLVQRAALDLLMVCFPMKNQQLLYSDMVRLVTAALTTILRRDMSLNRRLYSWLLGAESTNTPTPDDDDDDLNTTPNHNHTVAYDLLNDALRLILKRCTSETPIDVKPYRLLTSLFDKPQIGPVILDSILYDVFRSLYLSCLHQQKQRSANGRCVSFNGDWSSLKHDEGVLSRQFVGRNCQELVKNANLLFDTLQGYYIWSYIEKLFGEAVEHATTYERREQRRVNEIGSGPPHILEICILTDFLLDIIPIEAYTESTSNILPSLFTKVVATLKTHLKELDHHEITESLQLCTKILNKLQPISLSQAETPSEALEEVEEKVLEKSKSDSRINENAEKNELSVEDAARERSYSNQMQKKKEKSSPRIEKKAKNKKSKSSPKLSESPTSPEQKEEPVVEAPPRATKIENKYCIECLEEYKSFFVQFVRAKLIPNTDIQTRFRSLIADKNERTESLRRMLSARILEHPKSEFNPVKLPRISSPLPPPNDPSFSENKPTSSTKSMTVASNVLLEFSAFPNLLGGEAEAELPAWARALVVVACCEEATRDVQLAAMNTLLEVFDRPGILDVAHVRYLEEHTVVVEAMARILWRLLGSSDDQHQLMLCVALLYRIHDTFDGQQFVENVIGGYLTRETASVHDVKRFFLLWHLGRDIDPKVRDFDRSLLKILDNLRCEDRPELQLLAESFLAHSLLHNDIHRILNPVLTKLLASDTARVCIKHVNIQWQSDATLEDDETTETAAAKKVYAISSVNGKIMYHVTEEPGAKPAKKKWFAFAKTGKKYATGDVVAKRTTVGNASPKGPKTVKLIVNPLGSKEVYPVGLEGCYSKRESHSSLESLSDSETLPFREQPGGGDRDSGFDSLKHRSQTELSSNGKESIAKSLLESMEPISDGIKADAAGARLPKSHSFDEKFVVAKTADAESSLVQSWSYCVSDSANLHASHELELSRSAEDFFIAQDEQRDIIDDILNAIVDKACVPRRPADLDVKPKVNAQQPKNIVLYPIHAHLCLYCEVFDSNQVVYALRTLKSCIAADPHLFIKCLATSGLKNLRNNDVLYQLARHRKSSLGFGFSGAVGGEHVNHYRGYMFLDVVVTVCLNYCRSFYPFLEESPLAAEEMSNNLKIQLQSLDVLDVIVKTLIAMVRDNTKGFSSYIADLLVKCKVQKILLNCLLTSVRNFDEDITFAEEILAYNNFQLCDASNRVGEHVEAFQVQILRLINSLIVLEHDVFGARTDGAPAARIPQQQIFLSAILSALRHHSMRHIHEQWLRMVTACLPYFGDNLKQIAISVVHQICNNVEDVAASYARAELRDELCSDYAVTQLEALTVLCHYCLLDSSQTVNQNVPASAALPNPGEIINNLFNAFFTPLNVDATLSLKQNSDNYRNARKTILGHMPRIISSVGKLWQTVVEVEEEYSGVYGSGKVVKQQLLEFLSPIAVHHGASFVAAVAVAWYERRNPFSSVKTVLPEPNAGQNNLVYLISAIRVIPLDNLVQTVTAVIKNPPPTEGLNADICLEVAVLELFYCYMRNASSSQFSEAWGSLLALVREGCALSPPSQFLLAALLHEIMIKCCPLEERKDQKDLQDVTTKLIDCVSQVCGSCLEQTTWLRRNFAVKEQEEDSAAESNIISGSNSEIFVNSSYSVQAQLVLSEILAPILDICFGSSEKDKVNAILTSLMFNIVPYLKTHTARNMPSFSACSKLLSALSSYQYTRKAWKKDVFDLLLDNAFFQMDFSCLKFWRVIVDNLMTHDNTTFRDLMNRVSMNQSGSLSIFSSREQEYEQKAQLLKRLAYVIFCSEMDQYAKYMPDIQEQLTSSLRLSVPGVQAQVFLCFRVILLRMSPLHVTSLWPIIISEMLQVFLQIEQELSTDTEEFRTNNSSHIKLMSSLDASWATNSNNGLHALGNPHWLRLQLATVKLLDLALLLPATTLPQFQMYRWAFVGDDLHRVDPRHSFLPHVVRIADLMDRKYADAPTDVLPMKRNEPLLTTNAVARLRDLHGFFRTLSRCSDRHRSECGRLAPDNDACSERRPDRKTDAILERIDKVVEMDFLDKIAR